MSDAYAHKCCKYVGIVSVAKHYKYHKPGDDKKVYPNLLLAGLNINGPYECIVSDMTAFYLDSVYFELTLYMVYGITKSQRIPFLLKEEIE